MLNQEIDESFMRQALLLADKAEQQDEIPVGAILVQDGEVIARGWNQSIRLQDPSAHAEMMAVREAGKKLNNYRLIDTTLYVTLEPCPMCAGLLVHARVKRLVFGAYDYKSGACGSVVDLVNHEKLNHKIDVTGGVLAEQCAEKLSAFFRRRRQAKKLEKASSTNGNST